MNSQICGIWRYPIKSHGRESLSEVMLEAGKTLPWDRHWAVQHNKSDYDGIGWASCKNFMIGTRTPQLAAIRASFDVISKRITLMHDKLGDLTFSPDNSLDVEQFFHWILPILQNSSIRPVKIVSLKNRGMTDSHYASVSIMNMSSHRSVSQQLGKPLEIERWRGNIWLDGGSPWEEFDWIGKRVRIGKATLQVHESIERCLHTTASPKTGRRDIDLLHFLEDKWQHRDFGVYAKVIESGEISIGDSATLI
ncbi:MAG: MOSC domain-containing protein [Aestuariivita sp.]|nr:MOSC domain-containing protein [Aestuariivita sp.]